MTARRQVSRRDFLKTSAQTAGGPGANESTKILRQLLERQASGPPTFIVIDRGDALEVLAASVKKLEAAYESPFQAHAKMEPVNTTVHVRDNEIEAGRLRNLPMKFKRRSLSFPAFP